MKCPKCGAENPDDAQLCESCSSVLSKVSVTNQHQTPITSTLAILSFVLGIMSIFAFPIGLIAIILGIVGIVIIKRSDGKIKGTGFAVLGITVSILAFLIYTPVVLKIRRNAFRMVCGESLSGLRKAILIYTEEHNGTLPTSSKWCDLLTEHTEINRSMFRCKKVRNGPCNYAMNKNIATLDLDKAAPYNMVLLFETHPGWNQFGGPEILTTDNHEGEGCNVLFIDLHIQFVRTKYSNDLNWVPD